MVSLSYKPRKNDEILRQIVLFIVIFWYETDRILISNICFENGSKLDVIEKIFSEN